jgi:hypothetical protein
MYRELLLPSLRFSLRVTILLSLRTTLTLAKSGEIGYGGLVVQNAKICELQNSLARSMQTTNRKLSITFIYSDKAIITVGNKDNYQ